METNVAARICQAAGLPHEALQIQVRPALGYQSNQLYDVRVGQRHLILKQFLKPDEWTVAPQREFRALERLAPLDIAPQSVFYEPALGPYVLYAYMEGTMWDRRKPAATDLHKLAELWVQVNAVPTEKLWLSNGYEQSLQTAGENFASRFRQYADWAAHAFPPGVHTAALCLHGLESRRALVDELAKYPPILCFCKADARFANVIERPDGRLGMVDWEDSGLRDPARDLADVMTHPNQEDLLTAEEWQAFLQPYLAVQGKLDGQLEQRMQLYLALFPFFWLALGVHQGMQRAAQGTLAGWTVNELPANLRLRRYLARALAWPQWTFHEQLARLADVEFFPASL